MLTSETEMERDQKKLQGKTEIEQPNMMVR